MEWIDFFLFYILSSTRFSSIFLNIFLSFLGSRASENIKEPKNPMWVDRIHKKKTTTWDESDGITKPKNIKKKKYFPKTLTI